MPRSGNWPFDIPTAASTVVEDTVAPNRKQKIKEMLASPIKEMQALGKTLKAEEDRKDNLHLDLIRNIQRRWPEVILGGSAAMYIHDIKLSRFKKNVSGDIDLIIPYYINFQSFSYGELKFKEGTVKSTDFDYTVECNRVHLDIRIDNKQKWEMINLDDYMYKVSIIEHILEAKIRYALAGNLKHRDDIYEMIGKIKEPQAAECVVWDGGS